MVCTCYMPGNVVTKKLSNASEPFTKKQSMALTMHYLRHHLPATAYMSAAQ